ncbi:MAG: response regulator [bacterium]|nr:response regulator [bacterium]
MENFVLIVDDDEGYRTITSMMLKRKGFESVAVSSVNKALEVIETHRPMLVVMDFMMPGINGIEGCAMMRHHPITRTTPIILFSASNDPTLCDRTLDAGANVFISKMELHRQLIPNVQQLIGVTL